MTTIGTILNMFFWLTISLVNIFGVLAFVAFFYGLAIFLLNREDKTANEKGKNIMVWGLIALFVLISIFGIIAFLQNTFGTYYGPETPEILVPQV